MNGFGGVGGWEGSRCNSIPITLVGTTLQPFLFAGECGFFSEVAVVPGVSRILLICRMAVLAWVCRRFVASFGLGIPVALSSHDHGRLG